MENHLDRFPRRDLRHDLGRDNNLTVPRQLALEIGNLHIFYHRTALQLVSELVALREEHFVVSFPHRDFGDNVGSRLSTNARDCPLSGGRSVRSVAFRRSELGLDLASFQG